MRTIETVSLIANSYFDAPVYLDEDYILLSADTQLTQDLKSRLQRWGYRTVYSDGNPKDAPTYQTTAEEAKPTAVLEDDIEEDKQIESSKKLYYSLIDFIKQFFKAFNEENKLELAALNEELKELINTIKKSRDSILRLSEYPYPGENYLYQHSVNTAILSLTIGDVMKLPTHRLIELGVAAILHDIGMFKIPENIFLNSRSLTAQERKMVNAHTVLGYKILKGFSVPEGIAVSALEHHERLNGSGYPNGLRGDKIFLYAKIIAASCSYDALISPRPFKQVRDGHSALLDLLRGRKILYDDMVIRALIYCLSLFPIGTMVELSSSAIGRVIKNNPRIPQLPTVELLVDQQGKRVEGQVIIETAKEKGITVKRGLTAEDVQKLAPQTSR